jgi:hypothetical protein
LPRRGWWMAGDRERHCHQIFKRGLFALIRTTRT